jgi:hypothetical protein
MATVTAAVGTGMALELGPPQRDPLPNPYQQCIQDCVSQGDTIVHCRIACIQKL